jgi:hypothetical protein
MHVNLVSSPYHIRSSLQSVPRRANLPCRPQYVEAEREEGGGVTGSSVEEEP